MPSLEIALDAETAGLEFYKNIYEMTTDPEIRAFAKEFSEEKSQHLVELKNEWPRTKPSVS